MLSCLHVRDRAPGGETVPWTGNTETLTRWHDGTLAPYTMEHYTMAPYTLTSGDADRLAPYTMSP